MCIDLIEHPRTPSLFKLLDEECMIKGTDLALLKKYNDQLASVKAFKRPSNFNAKQLFVVAHYAGDVEYNINAFLEKNKDTVNDIIIDTLALSKSPILSNLFSKDPSEVSAASTSQKG